MRPRHKKPLTERTVRTVKATTHAVNYWDQRTPGLLLRVQPSGHRAFKFSYSFRSHARWVDLGPGISLEDARKLVAQMRFEIAQGRDPWAERQAHHNTCTFERLHHRYVEEYAKLRNKSWTQADALVRRHLLPAWGNLDAKSIARKDVRETLARIPSTSTANQTFAAGSAVFTWAVKQEILGVNPCNGIERTAGASRERILSDSEVAVFWKAFDDAGLVRSSACKVLLLCGQRPGEVAHMRKEHIKDNVWTLPGKPDGDMGWPGVKNSQTHSIWLPEPVRAIIAELVDDDPTGFVFATDNGSPISGLDIAMRAICKTLGIKDKITPHDLRRTHGSTITKLGFGRDAMNRIQNHKEGGIASVYDRHQYFAENRTIMERVASHLMELAEGRVSDTVVALKPRNRH
jgi:integrase